MGETTKRSCVVALAHKLEGNGLHVTIIFLKKKKKKKRKDSALGCCSSWEMKVGYQKDQTKKKKKVINAKCPDFPHLSLFNISIGWLATHHSL